MKQSGSELRFLLPDQRLDVGHNAGVRPMFAECVSHNMAVRVDEKSLAPSVRVGTKGKLDEVVDEQAAAR